MPDTQPDYYDCYEWQESLSHETIDEAVESYLDSIDKPFPETVKVYAWRRVSLPSHDALAETVGQMVLEWLDDEYSSCNIDPGAHHSKSMNDAIGQFASAILSEYVPYDCNPSPADDVTVNVAEWIREHRPQWEDQKEPKQ